MTKQISPRDLSGLIATIYDCALDPARWDRALAEARDAFEAETAVLHLNDTRTDRVLISRSIGVPAGWQRLHDRHAPEINARLAHDLASWPSLDEPHVMSRHLPPADRTASPYIQECLKPNGIVDVMTCFLMHTPSRLAGFAVGRHERQGIITEREVELGGLLLPHIRRAVAISNVLEGCAIERARLSETLDALRCAVVLADEDGVILHANRAAEQMLREARLIRATGGVLRARHPTAAAELRAAIACAARDEAVIATTGLAIRLSGDDAQPVFAHVLPTSGGEVRARLEPAAVAAVFIGAMPDEQAAADMMAAFYGLTMAERRVLASLLTGRTLAETAQVLGTASTTAKTHLDKIFAKTGITRQVDLIRLGVHFARPGRSAERQVATRHAPCDIAQPSPALEAG